MLDVWLGHGSPSVDVPALIESSDYPSEVCRCGAFAWICGRSQADGTWDAPEAFNKHEDKVRSWLGVGAGPSFSALGMGG
jgi:hypothetical protein